ncbi:RICIN domain-containing protein [Streptomyces sp. NPDC052000]|uniref:RICIN domain-containing protein n=1 Tax=Streptomyces sp. NPDC052000 TaxID=3155676 RepID=UPI00344CB920
MKKTTRAAFRAGTVAASTTLAVALAGASPASATYHTFLINGASGKCLEVPGGNGSDGAPVQQWDCNQGDNQKWVVYPTSDGYSTLVNFQSGDCLDVPGLSKDQGAPLQQWSCNGGDNQKWVISGRTSAGEVTIRNKNSWLVIDNPNSSGSNGTQMIQFPYDYGRNQTWKSV